MQCVPGNGSHGLPSLSLDTDCICFSRRALLSTLLLKEYTEQSVTVFGSVTLCLSVCRSRKNLEKYFRTCLHLNNPVKLSSETV